jgi:lipopolysaccharide/colanic/teichoic acid biosynthesis glycosyltransferase
MAFFGLFLLSPLLLLMAFWVKLDSKGPVFFRQERVGRYGVTFRIFKFRTMTAGTEKNQQLTVGNDVRITRAGYFLRRYKIDELPQLINVLFGAMSLVGPRPEVPMYVKCYPAAVREIVLSVPPGITDWASIKYKAENSILGNSSNPEKTYIEEILPIKLKFYLDYVNKRTMLMDLKIIFTTIVAIFKINSKCH